MAEVLQPDEKSDAEEQRHVRMYIAASVALGLLLSISTAVAVFGICGHVSLGRASPPWVCRAIWDNPPWVLFSSVAAAPALILTWHWRSVLARKQVRIQDQQQVSSRFAEAVRLLSETDKLEARLGAIYSLERIAKNSPADHPTVVETLCAFVRSRAPTTSETSLDVPEKPLAIDIRAATTVLARLGRAGGTLIDLSGTTLRRANVGHGKLSYADLSGTNLGGANLRSANLREANLAGADLTGADLAGADLALAKLGRARLTGAGLTGANLNGANLTNATLVGAQLRNANLTGADLTGADITGADITGAQLSAAHLIEDQLKTTTGTPHPEPVEEESYYSDWYPAS